MFVYNQFILGRMEWAYGLLDEEGNRRRDPIENHLYRSAIAAEREDHNR
ncbi:hypothetical protein BACI349Y_510057 [Bacillus sp. 349Y]|nr:hypothetical protein BACI349Y_510057 [Bacillus sp. 349Y]